MKAIIQELLDYENEFYFNDYLDYNDIIIWGNSRYAYYNADVIDDIRRLFDEFNVNCNYPDLTIEEKTDIINYYLKEYSYSKSISTGEAKIMIESNFDAEKVLSILFNCCMQKVVIKGCSQGEYQYLFYNKDQLSDDDITIIESLYFGACYRVVFNIGDDVDLEDADFEDLDYDDFLTVDTRKENVIERISKITHQPKESIKLYEPKEKIIRKVYYEEAK